MLLYSPVYVILITFFITLLSLQVSFIRWKFKIPSGNGNLDLLTQARKAHWLTLEYAAVFIPILICSELMGAPNRWIAGTSLVFLGGRLIHTSAIMTSSKFSWPRLIGVSLSHGASLALMGKLVWILSTIQL